MKECDILGGGVKTYSDPSYIFSQGQDRQPPVSTSLIVKRERRGLTVRRMWLLYGIALRSVCMWWVTLAVWSLSSNALGCKVARMTACTPGGYVIASRTFVHDADLPRHCSIQGRTKDFSLGVQDRIGGKSRVKADSGGRVLGEEQQAPSHQLGVWERCELPSGVRGGALTAQMFSTIFLTKDGVSWHCNIVNCGLPCSPFGGQNPRTPLHTSLAPSRS